ncbi:MAG: AI-2E family transporter [Erysipelotrichaceae bacterium]|nr:AI-2E family transporter [Erysipelotrichaceae bacterium]
MKKYQKELVRFPLFAIPALLSLFLLVILLKQLSLYNKLVDLYHALFPVFGGIVIAFLLQPIIDRLAMHMKVKTAVIAVYAGILAVGALLLMILLPILYRQIVDFVSLLPDWLEKLKFFLNEHHIVMERLADVEDSALQEGTMFMLDSLRTFFGTAMDYAIAYMTAFFISIDVEFCKRSAKKLFRNYHRFVTFYKTLSNIVFQYLTGTLLDLIFVSVTSAVVLYAAAFPNALLYAIILALSNLFPYIGPTVGLLFVILVGVLSYEQLPLITIVLIWTIQQIESNIVQPMIFNKTMDVRPILTFVALFIAEALFGIPGILLSPILASIIQIAFRSYLHAKTKNTVGEWEDIWYDFDDAMKGIPVPPQE